MALNTVQQTGSAAARDEVRRLVNRLATLTVNHAETSGVVGIGTTTTKVRNTATITYSVDGVLTSKTSTDDLWTLSGTVVPVSSFQKYLLCLDAAGAASIIQGVPASSSAAVVLPAPPQGKCIVGVVYVATDATHTFTPGTDALTATGITTLYTNGIDGSLLHQVTL